MTWSSLLCLAQYISLAVYLRTHCFTYQRHTLVYGNAITLSPIESSSYDKLSDDQLHDGQRSSRNNWQS